MEICLRIVHRVMMAWEASALLRLMALATVILLAAGLADRWVRGRAPGMARWVWRVAYVKLALAWLWGTPVPLSLIPGDGSRRVLEWTWAGDGSTGETAGAARVPSSEIGNGQATRVKAGNDGTDRAGGGRNGRNGVEPTLDSLETAGAGWNGVWMGVWAVGCGVGLVRAWRGWNRVRRWVEESREAVAADGLKEALEWLKARACRVGGTVNRGEGRCLPEVRIHEGIAGPMAVGWRRRLILMPAGWGREMGEEATRAALMHELAHHDGGDLVWRWVRVVVGIVHWVHPLMRWAERRALLAEEVACDRAAWEATSIGCSVYTEMLVRAAEWQRGAGELDAVGTEMMASMGSQGRGLAERVRAFGSERRRMTWGRCWAVAGLAWVILPLGLVTWSGSRGVRQMDARYPVVGYRVSQGGSHEVEVARTELCWGGWRWCEVREGFGSAEESRWIGSAAGWVQDWGGRVQVNRSRYRALVGEGENAWVLMVRFRTGAGLGDPEALEAELVDLEGETIPLVGGSVPAEVGREMGERVRYWVLDPAPRTEARFDLRILKAGGAGEVARLDLGWLGGTKRQTAEATTRH